MGDPHELDYELPLDDSVKQVGIGVVGAGFIIRDCHLLAYQQAGFKVVGITSRTRERADQVAALRNVPRVYDNLTDLLADAQLEVVAIGVPPQHQPEVIRQIAQHGGRIRGILAQKPLAMSLAEAAELVALCEAAGITLAVNQNMRHDHAVRACKDLLNRGLLGAPVLATIDMRAIPHWMDWSRDLHSLSTFVMSIHHLDCLRYWLGDPVRVMASTRPDPRTTFPHRDGINLYILEFASGARAASWDDVWTGPAREGSAGDMGIRWRVEGTGGLALGTIGWPRYPAHSPSTLDYTTRELGPRWIQPRWEKAWFPDAFRGTMGELLTAVVGGTTPSLCGRDNLKTLALVEAVYESARSHRMVELAEIGGPKLQP